MVFVRNTWPSLETLLGLLILLVGELTLDGCLTEEACQNQNVMWIQYTMSCHSLCHTVYVRAEGTFPTLMRVVTVMIVAWRSTTVAIPEAPLPFKLSRLHANPPKAPNLNRSASSHSISTPSFRLFMKISLGSGICLLMIYDVKSWRDGVNNLDWQKVYHLPCTIKYPKIAFTPLGHTSKLDRAWSMSPDVPSL